MISDLNILLLVNGQGKTLTFNEQKLRNGERRTYVNEIAKVSDTDVSSDHMAYPCGIYIYQKVCVLHYSYPACYLLAWNLSLELLVQHLASSVRLLASHLIRTRPRMRLRLPLTAPTLS